MSFFKPENFNYAPWSLESRAFAADQANKLLSERGVRVYGHPEYRNSYDSLIRAEWREKIVGDPSTHQALLINIEELPKKECAHIPFRISCAQEAGGMGEVLLDGFKPKCAKCGVKLRATWAQLGSQHELH